MVKALCTQYSAPLLSLPPPLPYTSNTPSTPPPDGEDEALVVPQQELEVFYPFPPPSSLAGPEVAQQLRKLGFG
jgi:N-glycosylase/DNA lyase